MRCGHHRREGIGSAQWQPTNKALREKREAIVIEHMESENRHEFDVTMDTFDHPRYELIATGEVYDGVGGRRLLRGDPDRVPRPAQRADRPPPLDDAVIVEAMLCGTHLGTYRGLPRPGASFEMASAPCSCSRRTA